MRIARLGHVCSLMASFALCSWAQTASAPNMDWAHWRLGHRTEPSWLEENHLTVTFGQGAPNFELVDRQKFDEEVAKAQEFNRSYHDKGYIVLRYVTTALGGSTDTPKDFPRKDQTNVFRLYQQTWDQFADFLGLKPPRDPTTWLQVHADGTYQFFRYTPYGKEVGRNFEVWGCPNNPDFIRFMQARFTTQAETGIDGSYIDWTSMRTGTCYCDFCRRNFIAYLNENLPRATGKAKYGVTDYQNVRPPEKSGDPFWMEWLSFRDYAVAEFHKQMRTAVRKYNPHYLIAGNINDAGYGEIARDSAANMELLMRDGYDDFAYTEMQHRLEFAPQKDEQGVKISNSSRLKYLAAAAHGKPAIEYAVEITSPLFANPTEKCLSAMAQINIAEAAAHQCTFREKRETPPGATRIYEFLAANEGKLSGTRLRSTVAVVASSNQFLADELSFALTTSRVLADRGIGHVVIVEDDLLSSGLRDYELIVVPYLPLLSIEKQQALVRYVQQGGSLLILGQSGVKDQHNVANAKVPLAELLGQARFPDREARRSVKKGRVEFVPLPIPASRYRVHLKSELFADVPEAFVRNRIDPDLRRILERVSDKVTQMLPGRLTRLPDRPQYVEVTSMLANDKSRMAIHLVNYDVTVAGDVTPAKKVAVEVALPQGKKVRGLEYSGALSALQPLKYAPCGSGQSSCVRFDADQVGIYGLAVLTLE